MRLKSLEIKGFKSFADKTVIHFDQDITGIIGPNGCGKSNIVDAIRWALGEQKSKSLRSDKMDNLIFNGTKSKNQASRASVALTFENTKNILPTDFTTVTLSRTLYRSGDSEYRLNDVTCRLKDIINLLTDTGISSDSYAIIELGMINQILNNRDNLRRQLFEQAAGISKFKIRKRETLNKLNLTDQDLTRVDDLLAEIENNLNALEKQARRAAKYKKLKHHYKEVSVQLAVLKLEKHKSKLKELKDGKLNHQTELTRVKTEIKSLEASVEVGKADLLVKEGELQNAQKRLNSQMRELNTVEQEKGILNERIQNLRQSIERLNLEKINDNKSHEILSTDIDLYKSNFRNVNLEFEKMNLELEGLKVQKQELDTEFNLKNDELNVMQKAFFELQKTINSLETNKAILENKIANAKTESELKDKSFKARNQELQSLNKELQTYKTKENELQSELEKLTKNEAKIEKQRLLLEDNLPGLLEEKNSIIQELGIKQNERRLLESFIANSEGFPDSVKFLQEKGSMSKNAQLLSDLIITDEKYRAALEAIVEPILSHFVVTKEADAFAGIASLIQEKKGRAGFLFADASLNANQSIQDIEYCISAFEVIDNDMEYRPILFQLLHHVYIVNTKEELRDLSSKHPQFVFVTIDGNYVYTKNSLSGGSSGSYRGKRIGRKKQLKEIIASIKKLQINEKKIEEKIAQTTYLIEDLKGASFGLAIQKLNQQQQEVARLKLQYETKIEQISSFLQNEESRKGDISVSLEEFMKQLSITKSELEIQIGSFGKAKEALEERQNKVSGDSLELKEFNELFNDSNINWHKKQNGILNIEREIVFREKQLLEIEQRKNERIQQIEQITKELNETQEIFSTRNSGLEGMYQQSKELQEAVTDAENVYFKQRGDIDEYNDQVRAKEKKSDGILQMLNEIQQGLSNLEIELLSTKERMSIEFGIDVNELLEIDVEDDWDRDDLDRNVVKMKNRLDNFGEVNPYAIEAYDEMKKRYDFTNEQKEDLLKAKMTLLDTISEIETIATEKFVAAYNQVRKNFKSVFRQLFNEEDQCDILLSDPSNPLESNIEILAKPKGKRPLTIDQLSGGEKSLTAISLIFSLYLLKPAPFCILDEVDAPLDDENVNKFNLMIRQFANESQFIIVTHNKNTMKTVDVIYGVVMANTGISTTVPVNFSQLN